MNNQHVLFFAVLLLPLIDMQNPSPTVVTLVIQADLQELPCCCGSNPSQIYLTHEKFKPKIECCLHSETKFLSQLRVHHTSNWSLLASRVKFSCFPGSILLVVMIRHFLEGCIHDKPLHKIVLNHQCLLS